MTEPFPFTKTNTPNSATKSAQANGSVVKISENIKHYQLLKNLY